MHHGCFYLAGGFDRQVLKRRHVGQRVLTLAAQFFRAVQQALAHLFKCRAARDDSVDPLLVGHLGPQLIGDDCLRHLTEVYLITGSLQEFYMPRLYPQTTQVAQNPECLKARKVKLASTAFYDQAASTAAALASRGFHTARIAPQIKQATR